MEMLTNLLAELIIPQSPKHMQEGICDSGFFFWNVVLAGLCVIIPEFEPGIHTVPGAAFPIAILPPLYVVLTKVFAGLTVFFCFHVIHLDIMIA